MTKRENHFLNKAILLLMVIAILFTGCGKTIISPANTQINGNSATISEYTETANADKNISEETHPVLSEPDANPENVFSIESPENKRLCLQFLMMDFLEIPDQLEDSCYVKLSISANKSNPYVIKEVITGGVRYEYEGFGTAYYVKDNVCYGQSVMYMTWNELADANEEVKYLYNARSSWKYENFYEVKTLTPEELYEQDGGEWATISGTLSHEIYPAGEKYTSNLPGKRLLWDDKMMQVGLWYEKLTGACYGNVSGDIYAMDSSDGYWICFNGMEPVKIPYVEQTTAYEFIEPIAAVEGANFEIEKENALYRLSFDLLLDPVQETQNLLR